MGFSDDVLCSPTQEFYMPVTKKWVPAYKLEIGDFLLSEGNKVIPVTHVELVKKTLKIYSIEVNKNHNFFVGRHSILTHNMVLPTAFTVSFGFSFGAGATAGGTAGSFLGPMGWAGGCVIGGLVGLAVKAIMMGDESIPRCRLDLNSEIIKHWYNDIQKPISNDWNHIFIKNGYKHGFIGGPNDEEPEKWWGKMVRILEEAYKDGEIKDNGYGFEISRPQSINPNFGDLTIRGKIVQGVIRIGTAFLRNIIK